MVAEIRISFDSFLEERCTGSVTLVLLSLQTRAVRSQSFREFVADCTGT